MKPWLLAAALVCFGRPARAAGPYIQGIWSAGNPVYVSQGASFMPSSLGYDRSFTSLAILYHPLSAGSLIPERLQAYLPPESWACTFGGGYAAAAGVNQESLGVGCGVNLLDSVRAWGSSLLLRSGAQRLGNAVKPGQGPVNLFAQYMWEDTIDQPLNLKPRWFFGAAFGF